MKWYLDIKTKKGSYQFPYDGYKTLREAKKQLELAERVKEIIEVKIVKK